MAELLIVVFAAAALVLYAVDRARKLRARARQMAGMNDRLDVAAAKIDEEQSRKRARVRASAELTSVMPAIKRPPLTIPGMGGPGASADEESAAAAQAPPPGEAAAAGEAPAAAGAAATAGGQPAWNGQPAADSQAAADSQPPADGQAAGELPRASAPRLTEGTMAMPAAVPADDTPAARAQTPEGTLIMPTVPGQRPERAGGARAAGGQIPDEHTSNQQRSSRR